MPGLSLTAAQAARLWGLDRASCLVVLQALVTAGRLRQTPDGRFCAAEDVGRPLWRRRESEAAA
jgi:DNA-binding IclR family transcriptional regulator